MYLRMYLGMYIHGYSCSRPVNSWIHRGSDGSWKLEQADKIGAGKPPLLPQDSPSITTIEMPSQRPLSCGENSHKDLMTIPPDSKARSRCSRAAGDAAVR